MTQLTMWGAYRDAEGFERDYICKYKLYLFWLVAGTDT